MLVRGEEPAACIHSSTLAWNSLLAQSRSASVIILGEQHKIAQPCYLWQGGEVLLWTADGSSIACELQAFAPTCTHCLAYDLTASNFPREGHPMTPPPPPPATAASSNGLRCPMLVCCCSAPRAQRMCSLQMVVAAAMAATPKGGAAPKLATMATAAAMAAMVRDPPVCLLTGACKRRRHPSWRDERRLRQVCVFFVLTDVDHGTFTACKDAAVFVRAGSGDCDTTDVVSVYVYVRQNERLQRCWVLPHSKRMHLG